MCHKPTVQLDTEMIFLGQPCQAGVSNAEGIGNVAEDFRLLSLRVSPEAHHCGRSG
jgi:hypothetical protein